MGVEWQKIMTSLGQNKTACKSAQKQEIPAQQLDWTEELICKKSVKTSGEHLLYCDRREKKKREYLIGLSRNSSIQPGPTNPMIYP